MAGKKKKNKFELSITENSKGIWGSWCHMVYICVWVMNSRVVGEKKNKEEENKGLVTFFVGRKKETLRAFNASNLVAFLPQFGVYGSHHFHSHEISFLPIRYIYIYMCVCMCARARLDNDIFWQSWNCWPLNIHMCISWTGYDRDCLASKKKICFSFLHVYTCVSWATKEKRSI